MKIQIGVEPFSGAAKRKPIRSCHFIRSCFGLALAAGLSATANPAVDGIDWPAMMADHDMVWGSLPSYWYQAPFLGNGEQGTMMYQLDDQTLQWDVGCSAAHDHRPVDDDDLSEKHVEVLNRGRLFIGHLELELPEAVTGCQARLVLWDAEAYGTLISDGGTVAWNTLVHASEPVMRYEMIAQGDLAGAAFTYVAEEAKNPRAVRAGTERTPANPAAELSTLTDGVQTAVHNYWAGGQTAVAYYQETVGGTNRLWLSVQHSYPETNAVDLAVAAVRAAAAADQADWVQAHRDWWHAYYPQSFVSTGDAYWDSFYWIQQYKMACATRDNGWIMDNQGPWLQPTAWNATWWNLNIQLSHSGGFKANRREMVSALSHRLDIHRDALARNVDEAYRADSYAIGRTASGFDLYGHAGEPGGRDAITADANIAKECGDLLWALHNVDLEYRYWMDTELRDDVLYPLLTRAVNYYVHFLEEEADGLYHLPSTYSPEYASAEDCSYDISLLDWGAGRLLELAEEQGFTSAEEPLIDTWTDIHENLVPVHTNSTGLMIGENKALTSGHRHWSHLLSIYPLRTLTPETAADRDLIQTSLDHWHSFGSGIAGYAFTGASCMSSLLGNGDDALSYLNTLKSYLKASTMYSEIGLPVIETPIHGAAAIQEMMLQSWNGRLRVFPGVASSWTDAQFQNMRGEGAFLTSARREEGTTQWVVVEAEAGGTVEVAPKLTNAQWTASAGVVVSNVSDGVYRIDTSAGDWVLFWPEGEAQPTATVEPVAQRGDDYRFGVSTGNYVEDDTAAPTPDPMSFAVEPYAIDGTTAAMTAAWASDTTGPIEYYFENTTDAISSGWINTTSWTNSGLTTGQTYGFRLQARDGAGNTGDWSSVASVLVEEDTAAPTPNPMTWAAPPTATATNMISMTASTASDDAGVEYYFACTAGGGHDSGWQNSPAYIDTGLSPSTTYTYTVKARDKSKNQNETAVSAEASATTPTVSGGQGPVAGVDFENAADSAFDRTPDDLNPDDGITVSADWATYGGVTVVNDAGAQTAGSTSGSYVGKLNAGSYTATLPTTAPTDHYYSWSITIPDTVVLSLSDMVFDWRQGTATASNSRWGIFNTSLDGGPGGTVLWSLADPVVRPNWENVTVDLSAAKYQNLSGTNVTFFWYTERTGSDIDTIVVSGTTSDSTPAEIGDIDMVIASGSTEIGLSWHGEAGLTYGLEITQDLTSESWDSITNIAGADALITLSDEMDKTNAFYRVKLME
jgi:hypothetical protein